MPQITSHFTGHWMLPQINRRNGFALSGLKVNPFPGLVGTVISCLLTSQTFLAIVGHCNVPLEKLFQKVFYRTPGLVFTTGQNCVAESFIMIIFCTLVQFVGDLHSYCVSWEPASTRFIHCVYEERDLEIGSKILILHVRKLQKINWPRSSGLKAAVFAGVPWTLLEH